MSHNFVRHIFLLKSSWQRATVVLLMFVTFSPLGVRHAGEGGTNDLTLQAIACKAQKRLCGRYQHLLGRGKLKVQVCTAIARELVGFIWAIACEVMGQRLVTAR